MQLFYSFIRSNKKFWINYFNGNSTHGLSLIDTSVNDTFLLYGILKMGLIFSHIHNLEPVAFPYPTTTRRNRKMIDSMCPKVLSAIWLFISRFFLNMNKIVKIVLSIKTKKDILNVTINGSKIGNYIYDQCYITSVKNITIKMRLRIVYALICYFADEFLINRYDLKLVIIGDPVYRGYLFELCRQKNIKCINAINVYQLQMHKYFRRDEFDNHCRYVSIDMIEKIKSDEHFLAILNKYFSDRFNGIIASHDVLLAYSDDKKIYSKEDLYANYNLLSGKPLVVVMAHCFSDSPHAYPGMLYDDYEEWLIESILSLSMNKDINFLVKEHPSAHLYNEQGLVRKIMASLHVEHLLLQNDVHTKSIIISANYIVTCGGTIGIEITSFGKPVILAAHPPYAKKGFTVEPASREDYEMTLRSTIQNIPALTEGQILLAQKTAFVMLELFNNYNESIELGRVKYILGEPYNIEDFFENVIRENSHALEEQQIFNIIKSFNDSDDVSIINYNKLQTIKGSLNSVTVN